MKISLKNKFKKWILNSLAKKDCKLFLFKWAINKGIKLKDYQIEILTDQGKVIGRGTSFNSINAVMKAFGEAYERYCVKSLGIINTNGCAVHYNSIKAKENSKLELLERDNFFFNFFLKYPLKLLPTSSLAKKLANKFDIQIETFLVSSDLSFTTLTRIILLQDYQIFGLGSSYILENSVEKSEIEASRRAIYYLLNVNKIVDPFTLDSDFIPTSFYEHGLLGFSKKYNKDISFLFSQNHLNECRTKNVVEKSLFNSEIIKSLKLKKDNFFYNVPLFFCKTTHIHCQNLFVGRTIDHINYDKFEGIEIERINCQFHPLN